MGHASRDTHVRGDRRNPDVDGVIADRYAGGALLFAEEGVRALDPDPRIARNPKSNPGFENFVSVHWDRDNFAFAWFGINVMASLDAPEKPATRLD